MAEDKINPGRSMSPRQAHERHFDYMYERAKSKDAKLNQLSSNIYGMYNYRPVINDNSIDINFQERQEIFLKRKNENQEKYLFNYF
jgi:hypothetical protein